MLPNETKLRQVMRSTAAECLKHYAVGDDWSEVTGYEVLQLLAPLLPAKTFALVAGAWRAEWSPEALRAFEILQGVADPSLRKLRGVTLPPGTREDILRDGPQIRRARRRALAKRAALLR
jgi:hypothetical protein